MRLTNENINNELADYTEFISKRSNKNEMEIILSRSLKWYYDAIQEERIDLKLLCCVIALDSLFSNNDQKIVNALPFRLMLLEARTSEDNTFSYPEKWVNYYKVRNKIVHGQYRIDEFTKFYSKELSEKEVFEKEADSLLWWLPDILNKVMKVIKNHKIENKSINSLSNFIQWLEQDDDMLIKSIDWIKFHGDNIPKVREYLQKRFEKYYNW